MDSQAWRETAQLSDLSMILPPPENKVDNGKSTIWRCMSHWTWGFSKECFFCTSLFLNRSVPATFMRFPTGSIESRDSFRTSGFQRWHWRASAIPLVPNEESVLQLVLGNINSWDASISWEILQYSTEKYRKIVGTLSLEVVDFKSHDIYIYIYIRQNFPNKHFWSHTFAHNKLTQNKDLKEQPAKRLQPRGHPKVEQ